MNNFEEVSSEQMSDTRLFGWIRLETIGSLIIVLIMGSMAWQSLASELGHQKEEDTAMWIKQAGMAKEISDQRVADGIILTKLEAHDNTLRRIEMAQGEILKALRSYGRGRKDG